MFRQVVAHSIAFTSTFLIIVAGGWRSPKAEASSVGPENRKTDDRKAALAKIDAAIKRTSDLPQKIALRKMRKLFERKDTATTLDLSKLKLTKLPAEIGMLTELTRLNLAGNQLSTLPPEIGQLGKLAALTLSGNRIATLPSEFENLTKLTNLKLDENQIEKLPSEIGRLENLRSLHLGSNSLEELPRNFGDLVKLNYLKLSHNDFVKLPQKIGRLTQLVQLDFSGNPLTEVKDGIWKLPKLELVKFGKTKLTREQYELRILVGEWSVTSAKVGGVNVEHFIGRIFRFEKTTLTMRRGGDAVEVEIKATISPKHIDLVSISGKNVQLGIYQVKGDELRLTLGSFEEARPKHFDSQPRTRQTSFVLKRIKK